MRLRRLDRVVDPLWVGGMMAILILGIGVATGGLTYTVWIQLVVLGTVFPVLLVTFALATRRHRSLATTTKLLLASAVMIASLALVTRGDLLLLPGLAVLHLAIAHLVARADHPGHTPTDRVSGALTPYRRLWFPVLFLVCMTSWAVALRLVWWAEPQGFILGSGYSKAVLIGALFLVVVNMHRSAWRAAPPARIARLAGTAVAVAVVTMTSFRVDSILAGDGFHHWSFYAGPSELVRQGHWLLWDVPSQYGFLSAVVLAVIPAANGWQSLFLLNAGMTAAAAVILFLVLRSLGRGPLNFVFALGVAVTAQFIRADGTSRFAGPQHYPSTGGLRFLWVVALMAILLRLFHVHDARRHRLWYVIGCCVWLVGVLWSAETAIYCSATWLPSCLILEAGASKRACHPRLPAWCRLPGPWVLLPIGLLSSALLGITAFYGVRLGHAPDWTAFIEFGRAYQSGDVLPLPLNPWGAGWALLVTFWSVSAVAARLLRHNARTNAIMWGACAGIWSTASYFLARPHPSNVANLAPVLVMSIAMAATVIRGRTPVGGWAALVRIAWVPLLTMILVAPFASEPPTRDFLLAVIPTRPGRDDVSTLLPTIPREAQQLLLSAHVRSGDAVAFVSCHFGDGIMPVWRGYDGVIVSTPRAWIPLYPTPELYPLSETRREEYIARFARAAPAEGWLIECTPANPMLSWVDGAVNKTYHPETVIENGTWRATYYERR